MTPSDGCVRRRDRRARPAAIGLRVSGRQSVPAHDLGDRGGIRSAATIRDAVQEVEREWEQTLVAACFGELRATLTELASEAAWPSA